MDTIYEQTHLRPVNSLASRVLGIPNIKKKRRKKKTGKVTSKHEMASLTHTTIASASATTQLNMVACVKCDAMIRSDLLSKHMKKVHCTILVQSDLTKLMSKLQIFEVNPDAKTSDKPCPVCGLYVDPTFLLIHQTTSYCMRRRK